MTTIILIFLFKNNFFNVFILKIIFLKIILIYFKIKNILKNNFRHYLKYPSIFQCTVPSKPSLLTSVVGIWEAV